MDLLPRPTPAPLASPPPENFADISYYVENFKLRLLRDIWTLYAEVLVSDSLLHMLPYQI